MKIQTVLRVLIAATLAMTSARAQSLAFSLVADAIASPINVYDEEVHRLDSNGRFPLITREMFALYVGDANQNGRFDDQPVDIDAIHWLGGSGPGAFLYSVTVNTNTPGGPTLLDGDVFTFTSAGLSVMWSESFFASATGTGDIDIDAIAVGPAGEIFFSFADDEITTSATLIAANGGATLSKQCVFQLNPGQTLASIVVTPAQAVATFNHAFGTTATTVVNVADVDVDPNHPGELIMTCSSTSSALRARVVSTFAGGTAVAVGGAVVSPTTIGLGSTVMLDGLAVVDGPRIPVLRALDPFPSVAVPGLTTLQSYGWSPNQPVQFVFTEASLPRPFFTQVASLIGYDATPLNLASPLFTTTLGSPALTALADASGVAQFQFAAAGLPSLTTLLVQTVSVATLKTSTPVALTLMP